MADAVVSPFLGIIFDRLTSPLFEEFRLLSGVSNELEKLSQTVATVRLVLHDAELKQINDPPTKAWLQKLKDAAYQADDIMDQCATEQYILGTCCLGVTQLMLGTCCLGIPPEDWRPFVYLCDTKEFQVHRLDTACLGRTSTQIAGREMAIEINVSAPRSVKLFFVDSH